MRKLQIAMVLVFGTLLALQSTHNAAARDIRASEQDPSASMEFSPGFFHEMRWRCIGPFRGGRTVAISGVAYQPNVFYMAAVDGGVWKTTDFGNTWASIFDDQPTGSVGALAVSESDPNVIYVGSGEGLQRPDLSTGDGIYKSTDAGKSWTHLGLRDAYQIASIVIDPQDSNRLFVAALGHPYGPNAERGIFRSTDGGQTFQKVLYKDENTGAADLVLDPSNPRTVYAVLWAARVAPWEIRSGESFITAGSGLFKSTDGGDTWRLLTAGLPGAEDGLGRMGIAVSHKPTESPVRYRRSKKGSRRNLSFRRRRGVLVESKLTITGSAAVGRAPWESRWLLIIPTSFMWPIPHRGNPRIVRKLLWASRVLLEAMTTNVGGSAKKIRRSLRLLLIRAQLSVSTVA